MATEIGSLLIDVAMGVARVEKDMGSIQKSLDAHVGQWEKAGAAIQAAVGAWVSIAALRSVEQFVDSGIRLAASMEEVKAKTGIAVEALSGLKYAAERNSVSWDTLQGGLRKFSKYLSENGEGGKSVIQALRDTADEFKSMPDGADKAALAMERFGRSGMDLIPLLNEGAQGIEVLMERNRALGGQIGTETAEAAHRYEKAMHDVDTAIQGVKMSIVTALSPWLANIGEAFVEGASKAGLMQGAIDALRATFGRFIGDSTDSKRYAISSELDKIRSSLDSDAAVKNAGGIGSLLSFTMSDDQRAEMMGQAGALAKKLHEFDKRVAASLKLERASDKQTSGGSMEDAFGGFTGKLDTSTPALDKMRKSAEARAKLVNSIMSEANSKASKLVSTSASTEKKAEADQLRQFGTTDAQVKKLAANRKKILDEIDATTYKGKRAILLRQYKQDLADLMGNEDEQAALRKTYKNADLELQRQHSAQVMAESQRRGEMITTVLEGFLGKNNSITKTYAIANAIMNTWQGVTMALADNHPPWSFIQAAAVLAQGMAAVENIRSTTPGGGASGSLVASPGASPEASGSGGAGGADATSVSSELNSARSDPTHITEIHFHGPVMGTDTYINNTLIPRINEAFRNRSLVAVMP